MVVPGSADTENWCDTLPFLFVLPKVTLAGAHAETRHGHFFTPGIDISGYGAMIEKVLFVIRNVT